MSGKRLGVFGLHKLAFNDEEIKKILEGNTLFEFSDKEYGIFVVVEHNMFAMLCTDVGCCTVPFYNVIFFPFGIHSVWYNPPFKVFAEGDSIKYYKAK